MITILFLFLNMIMILMLMLMLMLMLIPIIMLILVLMLILMIVTDKTVATTSHYSPAITHQPSLNSQTDNNKPVNTHGV